LIEVRAKQHIHTKFGTTGKLVSSAYYDKQQVCVYLQLPTVLTLWANGGKIRNS